jgi:hypothetical protein
MLETTGLFTINDLAKDSLNNSKSLYETLQELLKEAKENVGGQK